MSFYLIFCIFMLFFYKVLIFFGRVGGIFILVVRILGVIFIIFIIIVIIVLFIFIIKFMGEFIIS